MYQAVMMAAAFAGTMESWQGSVASDNPTYSFVQTPVTSSPATVVVIAPLGIRLKFDGVPVTVTGERTIFTTPPLPAGRTFTYRVRADLGGDSATRVVQVRSGETSTIRFSTTPD